MIYGLVFYMFSGTLLLSALAVISSRNPVNSVLFLILAFFNAAGLTLLLGAEFIAMILVIVYVGAVAVLFLFVVMMLDISFENLREGAVKYLPVGGLVGFVLMSELVGLLWSWDFGLHAEVVTQSPTPNPLQISNTHALGTVLYTDYVYLFQACGLILLVAMVGAIVLSHRKRPGVRKQVISDQVNIKREDVISVEKVKSGAGVS